jgi:hypothetical protein
MSFDNTQIHRYGRQILLDAIGGRGQRALLSGVVAVELEPDLSSALVAIAYLSAAGVATVVLDGAVDAAVTPDDVGLLLDPEDVGTPRSLAIAHRVAALNPDVHVIGRDRHTGAARDEVRVNLRADDIPMHGPSPDPLAGHRWAVALWVGGSAATDAIRTLLARAE